MFLPFNDFKISSKLISNPAIITSKKIPNSEITLMSSVLWIIFNNEGPTIIPAMISPIIAGCLNLSKISPKTFEITSKMSRLVKKGNSILATGIFLKIIRQKYNNI